MLWRRAILQAAIMIPWPLRPPNWSWVCPGSHWHSLVTATGTGRFKRSESRCRIDWRPGPPRILTEKGERPGTPRRRRPSPLRQRSVAGAGGDTAPGSGCSLVVTVTVTGAKLEPKSHVKLLPAAGRRPRAGCGRQQRPHFHSGPCPGQLELSLSTAAEALGSGIHWGDTKRLLSVRWWSRITHYHRQSRATVMVTVTDFAQSPAWRGATAARYAAPEEPWPSSSATKPAFQVFIFLAFNFEPPRYLSQYDCPGTVTACAASRAQPVQNANGGTTMPSRRDGGDSARRRATREPPRPWHPLSW